MINLYNTNIAQLYIHKVGNKTRNEGVMQNELPTELTDEMRPLVKEFFFKPFRDKEETYYHFVHEADLDFHDMHTFAKQYFDRHRDLSEFGSKVIRHLYAQHNHPHIKAGEIYITQLENLHLDNVKVEAIGIFKSELRQEFMQFRTSGNQLEVILQEGVNLAKLDKGVIIFNVQQEEGYKILVVDSNRYDTKYWLENFLGVDAMHDENFYTKKYLKFCQDFSKDVVRAQADKKEEIAFMNRAVNHFASNDEFQEDIFINEVIEDPDLIPEFMNYKMEKGLKYSIEDLTDFAISNTAVKEAGKKHKSEIRLDTNVKLKMDFIDSKSFDKFVEKGWDEERQMYYYLVYFNKELK